MIKKIRIVPILSDICQRFPSKNQAEIITKIKSDISTIPKFPETNSETKPQNTTKYDTALKNVSKYLWLESINFNYIKFSTK